MVRIAYTLRAAATAHAKRWAQKGTLICRNTRTHVLLVILKGGTVIQFMSLMTDLNGNLYHTPIPTLIVTGHEQLSGEMVEGIF